MVLSVTYTYQRWSHQGMRQRTCLHLFLSSGKHWSQIWLFFPAPFFSFLKTDRIYGDIMPFSHWYTTDLGHIAPPLQGPPLSASLPPISCLYLLVQLASTLASSVHTCFQEHCAFITGHFDSSISNPSTYKQFKHFLCRGLCPQRKRKKDEKHKTNKQKPDKAYSSGEGWGPQSGLQQQNKNTQTKLKQSKTWLR